MNDRFKFRAFCYGNFIYRDFSKEYSVYNDKGFPVGNVPNDIEWEQCTGLKDKNGELIYEGDILGYKDYADKRFVVWDNKYMAYRVHDEDNVDCGSVYQEYIGEFGIEVIGNIHENKELLDER